ncbi:hypothetical protein DNTS_004281 [Danionella cerebrum]|uniref:RNA-binding protein 48 n=1 Tax=Danionella cerebrum TaxID=2873325 RepID=A0A553RI30_9TELE|nr:hypothetical protein DNTS_004281 [Danionella translucida]
MVLKCAFHGCKNQEDVLDKRKSSDERLSFHAFPTLDLERLRLWLLAAHRDVDLPLQHVKQLRICSEHFSPEDFKPYKGKRCRQLRSSAVPHVGPQQTEGSELTLDLDSEPECSFQDSSQTDSDSDSPSDDLKGDETYCPDYVQPTKKKILRRSSQRALLPKKSFKSVPLLCGACGKVLVKGQKAFECSDSSKLYCSLDCFRSTKKKTCHNCLKDICDVKSIISAPVDMSGSMMSFCSQKCHTALTLKCRVCQKTGVMRHEVNFMGCILKLCSDDCFTRFRSSNKLTMNSCVTCGGYCYGTDAQCPSLSIYNKVVKFCSSNCLNAYKKRSQKPVTCKMCNALRPAAKTLDSPNAKGVLEVFCSASCVTASKNPKVRLPVESGNAKGSLSEKTPITQVNTITSTSSNKAVPKPVTTKLAPTASTAPSGKEQNEAKIPCYHCLETFSNKPELLEYKRKMHAFCGNVCTEEFKKINSRIARCEQCKRNKAVTTVRRIDRIECLFCDDGCKSLHEQKMIKQWGDQLCHNCFYCEGMSSALVTEEIDGKEQEFCGKECLIKLQSIIRQEVKCSMCNQVKPMKERVKWLGEMKDFCSRRCLLFYCSLRGVTGAAIKAKSKTFDNPSLVSVNNKPDRKDPVAPSQTLKKEVLQKKTATKNKSTFCKPLTADAETQIEEKPKVIVLPIPVPVFVPVPMNLYTQYTPQPLGIPFPVPVPFFLPTTLDNAENIIEAIKEIKEKISDDPLEADLVLMAEKVAEEAEKEKSITSCDTMDDKEDLDVKDLCVDDPVSPAPKVDKTPEPDVPPPSRSDRKIPVPSKEPQMDLEMDFPVETIENIKDRVLKDSSKRKSCKRGHEGIPKKKQVRKSAPEHSSIFSKVQNKYGVNAWKDWVHSTNAQPNTDDSRVSSSAITLKEDVLKCSMAELSYGLCKFISGVRRPNGSKYSPDSIFYLCLGIQQYLFENGRMENIFSEIFYSDFCFELRNMLKGWKPTILPSGYIHSRVEEEYLWECKQLGAFTPGVLLNTLVYLFTKYFNYKTVEEHRCLSFATVRHHSKGPLNNRVSFLGFHQPKLAPESDGVPVKRRKKKTEQQVWKIPQNPDNPLRCPVRLYEFYVSKCPRGIRDSTSNFYLSPERSCVPSSPTWFSSKSLSNEALDCMLARICTVREIYLETEKRLISTDSDSDSGYTHGRIRLDFYFERAPDAADYTTEMESSVANPSVWDTQKVYKHHEQQNVAQTRPKYREGRRLKAVKVYTINLESRFLMVHGVPAIGVMPELVKLFALYGVIEEYRALDEYPAEQFTEVYLIKYQKLTSARVAKRHTDEKSFFGGQLHVCYAPEYETVEETRQKLQDRRRYINRATQNTEKICFQQQEVSTELSTSKVKATPEIQKAPEETREVNLNSELSFPFLPSPPAENVSSRFHDLTQPSHMHGNPQTMIPMEDKMGSLHSFIPPVPEASKPTASSSSCSGKQRDCIQRQKMVAPAVRFMPRTTHLESRKRKLDERTFFLGENNESVLLIGPKLPETPKLDMEDNSLNVTAHLIRQTMNKVTVPLKVKSVPEVNPVRTKKTTVKARRRI